MWDFDQMHLYVSYFYFYSWGRGNLHLTLGEGLGSSHVFSVQSGKQ